MLLLLFCLSGSSYKRAPPRPGAARLARTPVTPEAKGVMFGPLERHPMLGGIQVIPLGASNNHVMYYALQWSHTFLSSIHKREVGKRF